MIFYKTHWIILIAILLAAKTASAQPEEVPPDVFEAQPGGYLYADYPGVFDDAEGDEAFGDGITIEMWIYFTEIPPVRPQSHHSEHWLIVAKPGSYFISAGGLALLDGVDSILPEGTTRVTWAVESLPEEKNEGCCGAGMGAINLEPGEFPLSRWLHIAYQIVVKKDGTHRTEFYDRHGTVKRRFSEQMGRTEAPLFVGGAPPLVTFENGVEWRRFFGTPVFESMKGYIDEIRISKGWRYVPRGNIHPKRNLRVDDRTIALWRFEEGPGAPFYRDSSGNDYTLFPGGALTVPPLAKEPATWGSLKRSTF